MCTLRLNNLEAEKVKAMEEISENANSETLAKSKLNAKLDIISEDGVHEEELEKSSERTCEENNLDRLDSYLCKSKESDDWEIRTKINDEQESI